MKHQVRSMKKVHFHWKICWRFGFSLLLHVFCFPVFTDLMIWYNLFYIPIRHIVVNVFYSSLVLLINRRIICRVEAISFHRGAFILYPIYMALKMWSASINNIQQLLPYWEHHLVYSWIEPIVLRPFFSSAELDLYQLLGLLNQISILTAQILTNWSNPSLWSLNL